MLNLQTDIDVLMFPFRLCAGCSATAIQAVLWPSYEMYGDRGTKCTTTAIQSVKFSKQKSLAS